MQSKYSCILLCLMLIAAQVKAQNKPVTNDAIPGNATVISTPAEVGPTLSPNFIHTAVPMIHISQATDITGANPTSDVRQAYDFKDGFNRTFQSVQLQSATINGQAKHLVQLYDNVPRPNAYSFLPYASSTFGFQTNGYQAQRDYYNNLYPDEGYTSYAHSDNISNSTQRATISYTPGKSMTGQGRGSISRQITNVANLVRYWDIDGSGNPVSGGYYPAGELFGNETLLPDAATGGITVTSPDARVYTDKEGRTVLKMVADSNATVGGSTLITYQLTYYVYDEMGKLRFVITPKAASLAEGNGWVLNTTWISPLCFQYTYDDKGRLRSMQKPGENGPTYVLYDRKNRPVMRQTPGERGTKQWEITFYDALGRVKATSLYYDQPGATPDGWQNQIDTWTGGTTANLLYYLSTDAGEIQYPAETAITNNTLMSTTWYDHYGVVDPIDGIWNTCNSTLLFNGDLLQPAGWETPVRSLRTNGMITGTRIRILTSPTAQASKTGDWKQGVIYYDDKGRAIYSANSDLYQGSAIHSAYSGSEYDFAGRLLLSKHIQQNNNEAGGVTTHTEWTKNIFDANTAVLTASYHKLDDGNWNILSSLKYDDLGRVQRKTLGNYGEAQDFSYNIRGQLTGINADYALNGLKGGLSRTFGESLAYDYGFSQNRYDGRIAGMIWRGSGPDNITTYNRSYAYGYNYDQSGRLKKADFRVQINTGSTVIPWSNTSMDYSVSNLFYDKNGNILSMKQRGVKPGTGNVDMDNMTYVYGNSNQLQSVSDNGVADYGAGDFHDVSGSTDYTYDGNGNLLQDSNKHITSVAYTHFNKPSRIVFSNGNSIEYSYDAGGSKVEELVMPAGQAVKRTDYLGNIVYQNDTLQYTLTGEGRTLVDGTAPGNTKEEYFVKDHLGNVRSTIDVITYLTQKYLATWEIASANLEGLIFDNLNEVRDDKPGSTDPDDASSARLNGAEADHRIGTSLIVKVMAGDKINMNVNNFYDGYHDKDDQPVTGDDMLATLVSTLTQGHGAFDGSESHNTEMVGKLFSTENYSTFQLLTDNITDPSKPKAYLNYVFFDENMNIVPEMSGAFQANGSGTWASIGTPAPLTMPVNGFMAVYLSNSTNVVTCGGCGNVFFDQLWVEVTKGNLLEENHYYPHGLPITGIGSQTASGFKEQRRRYQGNEYIKDLGLNWMDFNARQYDPQIGRFLGVDPLAAFQGQDRYSPYAAMGNAPESQVDPNGLVPGQGTPQFSSPVSVFSEAMGGNDQNVAGAMSWGLTGGIGSLGGADGSQDPFHLFSSGFPALVQQAQAQQTREAWIATVMGGTSRSSVANNDIAGGSTAREKVGKDAFDNTANMPQGILLDNVNVNSDENDEKVFGSTNTNKAGIERDLFDGGILGDKISYSSYEGVITGKEGKFFTKDASTFNGKTEGVSVTYLGVFTFYGSADMSVSAGISAFGRELHLGYGIGVGLGQFSGGFSSTQNGTISGGDAVIRPGTAILGTAVGTIIVVNIASTLAGLLAL